MAFTHATQQARWLGKFMDELGMEQERLITIFVDNTGAIANVHNNKGHRHTKHIDVKHHFVKEKYDVGEIDFTYVPSADNLADILTKLLSREATNCICRAIGLYGEHVEAGGVL
jgi:hypothetical protein